MIEFKEHTKGENGYGPTEHGLYYQPAQYHNKDASGREEDKSKWTLIEPHQYCVFKYGDECDWRIPDKGIIGLNINESKKLEVLGTDNERVAFFPEPSNGNDPWHGYPIKMSSIDNSFDNFFIRLRDSDIISSPICRRLIRKMI